jgi:hypothetical protein
MVFDVSTAHLLGLLLSVVFPLLVGLVTKTTTEANVRAVLLAGLAAASGVVTEALTAVQSGTVFNIGMALTIAVSSFIIAVGMHFGLFKPTGLAHAAQAVGDKDAH